MPGSGPGPSLRDEFAGSIWFVCPGMVNGKRCGRREAILYGPEKYFQCRHCYDLRYESQHEDQKNRALRRAQKIRKRLGGSANMMEQFPEKPKGMHWWTCVRLWWEHHDADIEPLVVMQAW